MNKDVLEAMKRLIAVLEAENDALGEARLAEATALLAEKQEAAARLAQAVREAEALCVAPHGNPAPVPGTPKPPSPERALLRRMLDLSRRNDRLLERAIAAQKRVIDLLTALPADKTIRPYGNQGSYAEGGPNRPNLFTSRA